MRKRFRNTDGTWRHWQSASLKHKDVSSNPSTHRNNQAWWHMLADPDLQGLLVRQASQKTSELQIQL